MRSNEVERAQPKGLLTSTPGELARRTLRAWQLFADVVQEVDLAGPTRSGSRTAKELVTAVGTWPDSRGIAQLAADAHAGTTSGESFRTTSHRLVRAHAGADDDEVRNSIVRSQEQTRGWLLSEDLLHTGLLATPSPLGPLPMGTVVHTATYQLAVTARDLIPAGAPPVPELDDIGLVALLDATAAVAARIGLVTRACAVGERVAVAIAVSDGGWRTTLTDDPTFPAVLGPEGLLVDLGGGRADFAALTRQLRFRDARGMLALAPVVDAIPDLPGGPLLKRTAQFARLLGRPR